MLWCPIYDRLSLIPSRDQANCDRPRARVRCRLNGKRDEEHEQHCSCERSAHGPTLLWRKRESRLLQQAGAGYTGPTSSNALSVRSADDRIQAVVAGIRAFGGRRAASTGGLVSDNTAALEIRHLALSTPIGASDLALFGALTGGEFPPGDHNSLTIDIRDSTGSGPRLNVYAHTTGSLLPENAGVGNRFNVAGSLEAFIQSNPGIDPPPGAEFLG